MSAPFTRIDHVQLAMPGNSEAEARTFYNGVLGMDEVLKPAELLARGGVWFQSGDVFLHLGVDPDFHAATKAHPALVCADFESLVERLRASGVAVTDDGRLIDGKRHCYIDDPFGNRIELLARRST